MFTHLSSMGLLQIACVAILLLFFYLRSIGTTSVEKTRLLRRAFLLATASWLGEDTCIRLYQYYFYDAGWNFHLDYVPLLIICIWPVVILSSYDMASASGLSGYRRGIAVGALVLADASLIEPIAVKAGLWHWTVAGLFNVPLVGIVGWAFFTVAAAIYFAILDEKQAPAWADLGVLLLGPVATHILCVGSWYLFFQFVEFTLNPWIFVALAWLVSAVLAVHLYRSKMHENMVPRDLLARIPAALFFMILLGLYGLRDEALVAYSLAFVPPYLVVTPWRRVGAWIRSMTIDKPQFGR